MGREALPTPTIMQLLLLRLRRLPSFRLVVLSVRKRIVNWHAQNEMIVVMSNYDEAGRMNQAYSFVSNACFF